MSGIRCNRCGGLYNYVKACKCGTKLDDYGEVIFDEAEDESLDTTAKIGFGDTNEKLLRDVEDLLWEMRYKKVKHVVIGYVDGGTSMFRWKGKMSECAGLASKLAYLIKNDRDDDE